MSSELREKHSPGLTTDELIWIREKLREIAFDWGSKDARMHDTVDPKLQALLDDSA